MTMWLLAAGANVGFHEGRGPRARGEPLFHQLGFRSRREKVFARRVDDEAEGQIAVG